MDTIKITNYKDLEVINKYNGKDIIITLDACDIKLRRRVIDFLCGFLQHNGIIKKISTSEFIIKVKNISK